MSGLQSIISYLNNPPFELNLSLVSLDTKSHFELLDIAAIVSTTIDPSQKYIFTIFTMFFEVETQLHMFDVHLFFFVTILEKILVKIKLKMNSKNQFYLLSNCLIINHILTMKMILKYDLCKEMINILFMIYCFGCSKVLKI